MPNHLKEVIDYSKNRIEELQKEIDQVVANCNALVGRKAEAEAHQKFVQELLDKIPAKLEVIPADKRDDKSASAKK